MEPVLPSITGKLVFDFAELGFIDSMGLGVIGRAQTRLRGEEQGRQIVVRNLNAHARKVFEITGLDRVLDVQPSAQERSPGGSSGTWPSRSAPGPPPGS